jgi:outer membrane beta-barrel protein
MSLRSISLIFTLLFSLNSLASEKDTYDFSWLDPDKEVFVLQNRKYRKVDRAYVNAGWGLTTSGAFVDSSAIQLRGGYFFSEDWGVELLFSMNSGSENATAEAVRNVGQGPGSRPFRRIVDNYMGGMFIWSPFYMKINTFNTVIYVDWMFGGGFGRIEETNNRPEFENQFDADDITETHTGFLWDVALQFYWSQNFRVRTDLTAFHYKALNGLGLEETFESNFDFTISLGYGF